MGTGYNWRRESHLPPTIEVAAPQKPSTFARLRRSSETTAASQDEINALAARLFQAPSDDARCVYQIGIILTDESTRQRIGSGEKGLGGAAGADWQRLYTAFKALDSDIVSCLDPRWMTDNGCVGDHGSWGVSPFITLGCDEPLLSEDRDTGLMRPIPLYGFEHCHSDDEIYLQALERTGLVEKLAQLLGACMSQGGTFDVGANRIQARRDRSTSEQLALMETFEFIKHR